MKNRKHIIVIIGPSRSGASILMQLLDSFGMTVSKDMISAEEHNPFAPYEDSEIFALQSKLTKHLSPTTMPPPDGWLSKGVTNKIKFRLKSIISDRLRDNSTIFGFKDPQTALYIPMWTQVFNELDLIPLYILATRQPKSVVASMPRQEAHSPSTRELFWLTNITEAIYQTGSNCFIVHYEDWFTNRAPEVAKELLRYTKLDSFWGNDADITQIIRKIIKPYVNRAVLNDDEVTNRYVIKLQAQLEKCRGDQFDRHALMDAIMECRAAMDEFSGWAIEAQRVYKHSGNFEPNKLKKDLEKSVLNANKYLQECIDLRDENENHRIKILALNSEMTEVQQKLNDKDQKLIALRNSPTFQIGQVIVKALTKPGKNTFLLPFYLLQILLTAKGAKK